MTKKTKKAENDEKIEKVVVKESVVSEEEKAAQESTEIQVEPQDSDAFYKACLADENVDVQDDVSTDEEAVKAPEGIGSTYPARTTAPSYSDLNWIHYTKGGYNYCIEISSGSCLPNCVGYAWGRWRELLGSFHNLSRMNAEVWYLHTDDGYARGQTPKVGAVICWEGLGELAGHVAIVEQVNADGSIVTSNSGYGSSRFWMSTIRAPYSIGSSFRFQGFIYNPNNYGPEPEPTPTPTPSDKFNVGDHVVVNGDLYVNANAATATGHVDNKETYITLKAPGTAHPYNTTGDLGWMDESSITAFVEPTPAPTTELHEGDTVKIVGPYASNSFASDAPYNFALGWTRQIIKIYEGRPFPYRVGNETGTTGYFQASSLEKL